MIGKKVKINDKIGTIIKVSRNSTIVKFENGKEGTFDFMSIIDNIIN